MNRYNRDLKSNAIFELNVTDACDEVDISYHANNRVSMIGSGTSVLTQNNSVYAPVVGFTGILRFLSPDLTANPLEEAGMHFCLPRAQYTDLSVFIVARRAKKMSNRWESMWSNDDGNWDKYIGYKSGSNRQ